MTDKEKMIVDKLRTMTTPKLIELWQETDKQEVTVEVAKVRGWLMAALEDRNPEAFDSWIDGDPHNGPEVYFI